MFNNAGSKIEISIIQKEDILRWLTYLEKKQNPAIK